MPVTGEFIAIGSGGQIAMGAMAGMMALPIGGTIASPLPARDRVMNSAMVAGKEGEISTPDSRLKAWVIPTNEELLIARDTLRTVKNVPRRW